MKTLNLDVDEYPREFRSMQGKRLAIINEIIMPDIKFSPCPQGNTYISVHYHQRTARPSKHKSRWDVKPNEEFEIFCRADIPHCPENVNCTNRQTCDKANNCPVKKEHRWLSEGHLYSFKGNAKAIIGKDNERFAKFEGNQTGTEWHGYPIYQPIISKELVQYWNDNGLISDITKKKIMQIDI